MKAASVTTANVPASVAALPAGDKSVPPVAGRPAISVRYVPLLENPPEIVSELFGPVRRTPLLAKDALVVKSLPPESRNVPVLDVRPLSCGIELAAGEVHGRGGADRCDVRRQDRAVGEACAAGQRGA